MPHLTFLKTATILPRLPQMQRKIKELEKKLKELEEKLGE